MAESLPGVTQEYVNEIGGTTGTSKEAVVNTLSNDALNDGGVLNTSILNFFISGKNVQGSYTVQDLIEAQLEEPINDLDPIVYHDPPTDMPFIVKLQNKTAVGEGTVNMSKDDSNVNIDAILVPVIRLNTHVLEHTNIVAMSITCTKFLPEITLVVKTPGGKFDGSVRPGLNNIIQVVMAPSIDGKYKKISLPFYITDVDVDIRGEEVTYTGILRHMPLMQHILSSHSILYQGCKSSVSPTEKCVPEKDALPNMWELFHEIAVNAKLGFASMKGLKEYDDHTVRNICSQNYKEMLEYCLSVGGINEKMIYDGWVDMYGYLVLVDVYKALNDDVTPANLAMYAETGLHTHNESKKDTKYEKLSVIRRVLTNSNESTVKSNIEIEEFYNTSNIGKIRDHGTLNTIFFFNPFGNGGINNVIPEQIRIKEDSADGEYVEDYEVQKYCGWSFIGCEEFNLARQMEIRNAYLTKIRNSSSRLIVRLKIPNFALQRGTLVTIVRSRYDLQYKMKVKNQLTNIFPGAEELGYKPDKDEMSESKWNDSFLNDGTGVTSPEDSGIYYIDGMRFDYITPELSDNVTKQNSPPSIQQYLYLIRRGRILSLDNICTFSRFDDPTKNK